MQGVGHEFVESEMRLFQQLFVQLHPQVCINHIYLGGKLFIYYKHLRVNNS
jgi:hypothetical protein